MNITTWSDSTALFIFSYSYSAVTSKIKAHHSSKIKLCESPFHQLLHARSYVNRLPSQRGRQRHRRPCQHHKKWQKPCLINMPGVQSHAFPRSKQIVYEGMESCGSLSSAQGQWRRALNTLVTSPSLSHLLYILLCSLVMCGDQKQVCNSFRAPLKLLSWRKLSRKKL